MASAYLQVENYKPSMILENRLAEVMAKAWVTLWRVSHRRSLCPEEEALQRWQERSAQPWAKWPSRSRNARKRFRNMQTDIQWPWRHLPHSSAVLLQLVEADAAAYRKVMDAYKLPKESPARDAAIEAALIHATDVPSRTAGTAVQALTILKDLQSIIHPNVASDFQVGLQMLRSAIHGGIANMRINIKEINDKDAAVNGTRIWPRITRITPFKYGKLL